MLSDFKKMDRIVNRIEAGATPVHDEIKTMLAVNDPMQLEKLFAAARRIRTRHFGNGVFLYGFVYFSTYCRNECRFCHYRQSNTRITRYRLKDETIIAISRRLKAAGVHLIDLTMGEDPFYMDHAPEKNHRLIDIVRHVKNATALPVMVSPGVISDRHLAAISDAGADFYACYQETQSRGLYSHLRSGQAFETRLRSKSLAKTHGMLIEEGVMTGVGESIDDLATAMASMRQLDADQVRVMTFIPQKNTPMSGIHHQGREQERVAMAVLRLAFPDRLIPASLDIDGLDGLKDRLDAGANVITSLVEPGNGLAGVANHTLDIENARRTPDAAMPIIKACGLRKATQNEFNEWLCKRKRIPTDSPEFCSEAV